MKLKLKTLEKDPKGFNPEIETVTFKDGGYSCVNPDVKPVETKVETGDVFEILKGSRKGAKFGEDRDKAIIRYGGDLKKAPLSEIKDKQALKEYLKSLSVDDEKKPRRTRGPSKFKLLNDARAYMGVKKFDNELEGPAKQFFRANGRHFGGDTGHYFYGIRGHANKKFGTELIAAYRVEQFKPNDESLKLWYIIGLDKGGEFRPWFKVAKIHERKEIRERIDKDIAYRGKTLIKKAHKEQIVSFKDKVEKEIVWNEYR